MLVIWEHEHCTLLYSNATDAKSNCTGSGRMSIGRGLVGRHVRLEFVFNDAIVYGFQIGNSASLS